MPKLVLFLLAAGLILVQILIGGARLVDALPAYLLIAGAGGAVFTLRRTSRVRPDVFCMASTVALAGYVIGRALLSPVSYLARPDLAMVLAALVVYLVSALYLTGAQQRFTMTLFLVLVGLAHFAVCVAQFTGQSNFMPLPWIFRPDFGFRASGFFISPNHLASLLGMLGVLTLSICCWSRVAISTRAFALYGFIVCLTGIALTGSKFGYISAAIGLGLFAVLSVFFAQRFTRPNFFGVAMATAFVLTVVVAVALLLVVRSDIYEKRLRHVRDPSRQAESLATAALQQHALAPAFGTGSGTFLFYGRQFHSPEVQSDPQHVHDEYLELLAEYGWTGLALFAFFLGAHLVSAIAAVRRVLDHKLKPTATTASNELALIVGTLCAVAIGGVHAARDFTFHLPANTLFAAFLFAILANPTGETAGRRERQVFPPWIAWSTPLFAAVLFVFCVVQLWPAVLGERARVALRDRQYSSALELSRRASRADAQNPDACYTEGEALRYLALEAADPAQAASLRREAVAAFERGLILFPRDVRLLLKLGQVLDDLRESARADGYFARALDAAPNSGTAQACCAIHWHRQWLLEKARGFYEAARSLGETELSLPGLRDLEHDEAIVRSGDAFSGFRPERGSSASPSAVP